MNHRGINFSFHFRNMDVATNRGNNLVISLLKYRFPNIFKSEQIALINNRLSRPIEKSKLKQRIFCLQNFVSKFDTFLATDNSTDQLCLSLLLSYVSENGKSYPVEIGENYTEVQKNQMAEYLVRFRFAFSLGFFFVIKIFSSTFIRFISIYWTTNRVIVHHYPLSIFKYHGHYQMMTQILYLLKKNTVSSHYSNLIFLLLMPKFPVCLHLSMAILINVLKRIQRNVCQDLQRVF